MPTEPKGSRFSRTERLLLWMVAFGLVLVLLRRGAISAALREVVEAYFGG